MTKEQTQWIFNHVERITNKYLAAFPLSDELWNQLIVEIDDIHKQTKRNQAAMELLIAVADYFDKLDHIYRRETKNE